MAVALLTLLVGGNVAAETMGLGAPDTVDMVYTIAPDFTTGQMKAQLDLYVFNDSNHVEGATVGFSWDNPNMQMDSANAAQIVLDNFEIGPFLYEGDDIAITNANQRFLFGAAKMFGSGMPPDPNRRLWASYYFTLSDWQATDSIVVDTLTFSTSTTYKFVGGEGVGDYYPVWTGPAIHTDTAYVPPVNLEVVPDSFGFFGTVGDSDPAGQQIDIASSGDPVDFDVTNNIPWVTVNPITGTTPQTGLVTVDIEGLGAGTYIDSFMVEAPDAENSPVWVTVTLTLVEPPPEIGVDPAQFFFNAVAGGDNPDPKTLTITNTGGQTLNWTVSNLEAWLTLAPMSGTDSGDVTLTVDITGLAFGEYYDTITVSDPAAENDPVQVPVNLSIGSDLPIIEVNPATVPVIVDMPTDTILPRTFEVLNGGAGTMSFYFTESSPRIVGFDPDTGTAPATVTAYFDMAGAQEGDDFYDTVWVNSNEAINSPQPVVFWFHFVDDPARLYVAQDTLRFTIYDCSMGYGDEAPVKTFVANNLGGDNPVDVYLEFDSTDYFSVNLTHGILPEEFTVTSNYLDLPLGTYYDTITVRAPKATESPHQLIVAYHVLAEEQQPSIYLPLDTGVLLTQENSGPSPNALFEVWNLYGGCMDFEIQEDIPWAFMDDEDGTAPQPVFYNVNSSGFPLGTYLDTIWVHAPDADNSPQPVQIRMNVFRYYGDVDWNGVIDIRDLVYLVNYMFHDGPTPLPNRIVGSCDCNPVVNIIDLVWLADYMFNGGPKPCGNP
jgi:hypothetical protein